MRNKLCKSMMVISIIFISLLFSSASAQQKQRESDDKSFEKMEGQFFMRLFKDMLSRNTLIHISVSKPRGWTLGDDNLYSLFDFPFVESRSDYAAFSHPSSHSIIFVSYKPIVGKSYFLKNPERVAQWYKETHFKRYKKDNIEMIEGSEKFYLKEIGGRLFYVIQNEIFTHLRDKRIIYIFLHISADMKSLYTFCFSTTVKEHIEESKPFQDFIKMISSFKINQIDVYEEALYRVDKKLWMGIPHVEVKWYNAIQDESIEELKNAVAIRPKAWELHYLLAEIYRSSYLLIDKEEESLSEVERMAIKQKVNIGRKTMPFSPYPINAEAAIGEYKEVIKLGCPKELENEIETRIKELQKQ